MPNVPNAVGELYEGYRARDEDGDTIDVAALDHGIGIAITECGHRRAVYFTDTADVRALVFAMINACETLEKRRAS